MGHRWRLIRADRARCGVMCDCRSPARRPVRATARPARRATASRVRAGPRARTRDSRLGRSASVWRRRARHSGRLLFAEVRQLQRAARCPCFPSEASLPPPFQLGRGPLRGVRANRATAASSRRSTSDGVLRAGPRQLREPGRSSGPARSISTQRWSTAAMSRRPVIAFEWRRTRAASRQPDGARAGRTPFRSMLDPELRLSQAPAVVDARRGNSPEPG